jgi:hypothetical protein
MLALGDNGEEFHRSLALRSKLQPGQEGRKREGWPIGRMLLWSWCQDTRQTGASNAKTPGREGCTVG